MSYLNNKPGSLEEIAAKMSKGIQDEDYQALFKKELEKAGKGIGSMTPAEKKAFFNKIDSMYKAKNESIEEKVDNPYAVGMAAAMKQTGDKPPLKKSTITKAHDIAKSIQKDEEPKADKMNKQQKSVKGESVELEEGKKYTVHSGEKNVKDIVGWAADFGKDSGIPGVMKNGITDIKYGAKKVSFGGKSAKNLAQYFAKTHGLKVTNEELEEGGVKDFLMDVEDDAGSMSLNDLIKKYYGLMGLTAQEIKKIYYRVNESVNEESEEKEEVKSLRDTIHDVWNQAANEEEKREEDAKWLKTEAKKSITEEKIKCPNCGHMNDADAKKCSNCGHDLTKSEEKDSKKKAMTGSPASKVDTTPEVEFEK